MNYKNEIQLPAPFEMPKPALRTWEREARGSVPTPDGQIEDFLRDCTVSAPAGSTTATVLYNAYLAYAESNGWWSVDRLSQKALSQGVARRYRRRRTSSATTYVGVVLNPEQKE